MCNVSYLSNYCKLSEINFSSIQLECVVFLPADSEGCEFCEKIVIGHPCYFALLIGQSADTAPILHW